MMFQLSRSLDDCVLTLKRGISPRYSDDGVIVINQRCIRDGRVVLENARRHDEKARTIPDDRVIRQWDVLVNSTGVGTLGRVAQFTTEPDGLATVDSHVTIVRPDLTKLDGRFFGYVMRAREPQITSMGEGATGQTELSRLRLGGEVLIPEPPLPLQRAIGSILGSIDDLIETNRRRIELLEEMAQAIYREWFVHFRFPGHENATFVDSPLGPIPEGWVVTRIGEVAQIDKGLSYKGEFLTDAGAPMANLKCIRADGGFRRDGTKPYSGPSKPKHHVVAGDIVMANTDLTQAGGVIGASALVPKSGFADGGIISHHLFAIRPREAAYRCWMMQTFNDSSFREFARGVASGTTVLGLRAQDVEQRDLALPSSEIAERFEQISSDQWQLIETLHDENEVLGSIRDLLLPKLVTGEIDVSSLDLDALIGTAS